MDITTITSALSGIKTAVDIAKVIKDSDISLERAELKLKLADIVSALADVKIELAQIQDVMTEKDRRIQELEEAFQSKSKLVRYRDAYYEMNEAGQPFGKPCCMHCWETNHRKHSLYNEPMNVQANICPVCKTKYQSRSTLTITAETILQ